jgi:hypothetical protein
MNIFILDINPQIAAQSQCDKHVVKMILESVQMLSTAHRVLDGRMTIKKSKSNRNVKTWLLDDYRETLLYKSAHVNHPCSIWCRESAVNYYWLLSHVKALCDEFHYRFNKVHKSGSLLGLLSKLPEALLRDYTYSDDIPAKFAVAISEKIYPGVKDEKNPVESYQEYYRRKNAEQFEMKWTKRKAPKWMNI